MIYKKKLNQYKELLWTWNKSINLVSETTLKDFETRHVLDCLQLLNYLPNTGEKILDMGSGAGLPGLLLAIAGIKNITLAETNQKKVDFLQEAVRELQLDVRILCQRLEKIDENFTFFVSRACAPLERLLEYMNDMYIPEQSRGLFHKGENVKMEINQAQKNWSFDYIFHPSQTHSKGVILEIFSINRRKA